MEMMDLVDGAEKKVTLSTSLADKDEQVYKAITFKAITFKASNSEIVLDV